MKTMMIAALAMGAFTVLAPAVANADDFEIDGNYATMAACQADGAVGAGNAGYSTYTCTQGADGLYYLALQP